jgi:hypothetical protein
MAGRIVHTDARRTTSPDGTELLDMVLERQLSYSSGLEDDVQELIKYEHDICLERQQCVRVGEDGTSVILSPDRFAAIHG